MAADMKDASTEPEEAAEPEKTAAEEAAPEAKPRKKAPAEPEPETGWFLTEGGSVIEMDLPLPEAIAQRVEKRAIVQVANADGDPLNEGDGLVHDDGTAKDLTALYAPPAKGASKAAWVGYAVQHGGMTSDGADALTKQDLIDRFGR